jgi:ABC-type multidrug transport system fused ATPase/permease subunit
MTNEPIQSRATIGWQLAKSALRALALHKRLVAVPLVGLLAGALIVVLWWMLFGATVSHLHSSSPWFIAYIIVLLAVLYVLLIAAKVVTDGALIYGATKAYTGQRSSVGDNFANAFHRFWPLLSYGCIAGTVGFIFAILSERLSGIGNAVTNIADTSWRAANYFTVPALVMSEQRIGPFSAMKRSIGTIKQVWGEGLVSNIGITLFAFLGFAAYLLIAAGVIYVAHVNAPAVVMPALAILTIIFIALLFYVWTLNAMIKAALYYYATTSTTPSQFNTSLLRAAMTIKKARKVFGS